MTIRRQYQSIKHQHLRINKNSTSNNTWTENNYIQHTYNIFILSLNHLPKLSLPSPYLAFIQFHSCFFLNRFCQNVRPFWVCNSIRSITISFVSVALKKENKNFFFSIKQSYNHHSNQNAMRLATNTPECTLNDESLKPVQSIAIWWWFDVCVCACACVVQKMSLMFFFYLLTSICMRNNFPFHFWVRFRKKAIFGNVGNVALTIWRIWNWTKVQCNYNAFLHQFHPKLFKFTDFKIFTPNRDASVLFLCKIHSF